MNNTGILIAIGVLALLVVCGGVGCTSIPSTKDIPVVKGFDAAHYMGTWHEIAVCVKKNLRGDGTPRGGVISICSTWLDLV